MPKSVGVRAPCCSARFNASVTIELLRDSIVFMATAPFMED